MQQAKSLRILVLDSCRDNPLAEELKRSIGVARALSAQRGLARIESPEGMIISYATQAGRTAEDGGGRNSPYTTAFLKHIEEQDEIGTIFRRIAADVYETTKQRQLPELSLSFIGEFYLHGRLDITSPAKPAPPDPCAAAGEHWKSAEAIGGVAAFEDHLARFPSCGFASLAKTRIEKLKNKLATPRTSEQPQPEESKKSQIVVVAPPVTPVVPSRPCSGAGAVVVSLSRLTAPLSAAEECSLKPTDVFRECAQCPEMEVVDLGIVAAVSKNYVTMEQFESFVQETSYDAGSCELSRTAGSWRNPPYPRTRSDPVVCVSRADAKAYAGWLARKTGKGYQLSSTTMNIGRVDNNRFKVFRVIDR